MPYRPGGGGAAGKGKSAGGGLRGLKKRGHKREITHTRKSSLDVSFYQRGVNVWVKNTDELLYGDKEDGYHESWAPSRQCGKPVFLPATVYERKEGTKIKIISGATLHKLPCEPVRDAIVDASGLYPINEKRDINDMVNFAHLHEAALIWNVCVRYMRKQIYTYAGPILLVMNPFKLIRDDKGIGIYDPLYMRKYRNRATQRQLDAMPSKRREAEEAKTVGFWWW